MSSEIKNKRPNESEEEDLPEKSGKKPEPTDTFDTDELEDRGLADAAADAYEAVDPSEEFSRMLRHGQDRADNRNSYAGLDSEYPEERREAREQLIAKADSWTPEMLRTVAMHLDSHMIRSLSTLPKDSTARKAVVDYAEAKLKAGGSIKPEDRESYVQALVSLSGLNDPAQLNERYGQLGLQFSKDKKTPPTITATLDDKTKLEFKEFPNGAVQHSYTRRPDRYELLNTF